MVLSPAARPSSATTSMWALAVALLCMSCTGEQRGGGNDRSPTDSAPHAAFVEARVRLPSDLQHDSTVSGPLGGETDSKATMVGEGPEATVFFSRAESSGAAPAGVAGSVGPSGLTACDVDAEGVRYRVVSRATSPDQLCVLKPPAEDEVSLTVEHSPVPGTGAVPVPMSEPFELKSYTSRDAATDVQRSVVLGEYSGPAGISELLTWWYGNHERRYGLDRYETDAYAQISGGGIDDAPVPKAHLYVKVTDGTVRFARLAALSDSEEQVVISSLPWAR